MKALITLFAIAIFMVGLGFSQDVSEEEYLRFQKRLDDAEEKSMILGAIEDVSKNQEREQVLMEFAQILHDLLSAKISGIKLFEKYLEPRLRSPKVRVRYDAIEVIERVPQLFDDDPSVVNSLRRIFINNNNTEKQGGDLSSPTRIEEPYDIRIRAGEALVSIYEYIKKQQDNKYKEEIFEKNRREIINTLKREALTVPARIWLLKNDKTLYKKLNCDAVLMSMSKQTAQQPPEYWEQWWENRQLEVKTDIFYRTAVIKSLGRIGGKDELPVLKILLNHSTNVYVKMATMVSILQIAPGEGVPALVEMTGDNSSSVSSESLRLLADLAKGDAGRRIPKKIRSSIRNAAFASKTLSDETINNILSGKFVAQVNIYTRNMIIDGARAKNLLSSLLNEKQMKWAIEEIKAGRNPVIKISEKDQEEVNQAFSEDTFIKTIIKCIESQDQSIRAAALEFVAVWLKAKDPDVLKAVRKRIEVPRKDENDPLIIHGEKSVRARYLAVEVLEKYGNEEDIEKLLILVKKDDDTKVKLRAALAVTELGGSFDVIKYVVDGLVSEQSWVVKNTAYTIAEISHVYVGIPEATSPQNYSDLVATMNHQKRIELINKWKEYTSTLKNKD